MDFHADTHPLVSRRGALRSLGEPLAVLAIGKTLRIFSGGEEAARVEEESDITCLAGGRLLATGGAAGRIAVWGPPTWLGRLARTPLGEISPEDWDRVRQGLNERPLALIDALLRLRWRGEVHAEEAGGAGPA